MLVVSTTPNQIGSSPAAVITGMRMGVVTRMIAAGGKDKPAVGVHLTDRLRYRRRDLQRRHRVAE